MTVHYEIEVVNAASDYYRSQVCEGPDAPAGEVPESVMRYATMLGRIAGHDSEVRVGLTRPVQLDEHGVTNDAWTCWLT